MIHGGIEKSLKLFSVFCSLDEEHRLRKSEKNNKNHFLTILIFKMNHNSPFNFFLQGFICNNEIKFMSFSEFSPGLPQL